MVTNERAGASPVTMRLVEMYTLLPAYASFATNAFVYAWRSHEYRSEFARALCCARTRAANVKSKTSTSSTPAQTARLLSAPVIIFRADDDCAATIVTQSPLLRDDDEQIGRTALLASNRI